ncbi:MAG: MgtC/SapB family protein [Promethearchaeota archaeon]
MDPLLELEMFRRLVIAAFLGFLIGLERSLSGHPAGERTHALAALGAAIFTVVSISVFPDSDPARITAGIITGLGFLGAGMILKKGEHEIYGLTTAAGIWAVGAIGVLIGAGMYILGIGSAILIGFILASERLLLKRIERFVQKRLDLMKEDLHSQPPQ